MFFSCTALSSSIFYRNPFIYLPANVNLIMLCWIFMIIYTKKTRVYWRCVSSSYRKHTLNAHRMQPALYQVLKEIKEKTGESVSGHRSIARWKLVKASWTSCQAAENGWQLTALQWMKVCRCQLVTISSCVRMLCPMMNVMPWWWIYQLNSDCSRYGWVTVVFHS